MFSPGSTSFAQECRIDSPVKIGATLALSGKLAFIGSEERDGLLLAEEEINSSSEQGRVAIQLIIEDNTGDPKAALSSVKKLLHVDKVEVIFSAFTHITQAIADVVLRENVLMLYASSLPDIAQRHPSIFRDYFDIEEHGRMLAQTAGEMGLKKLVFIREEGDSCEAAHQALLRETKVLGISVLSVLEFHTGESDFKPLLLRAKSKKPDAYAFCAWRDTQVLITQLLGLGLLEKPSLHILAPFLPEADTPEFRKIYEEHEVISTWYGFAQGTGTKKNQDFVEKFKKRYQREPRPDAAYAYDGLYAIVDALRYCLEESRVDQGCARAALLKVKRDGPSGVLSFDASGNSNRETLVVKVRNGKWDNIR
jgi:branched-chain amino acid transport system substrate-binding protein